MCKTVRAIETLKSVNIYSMFTQLICQAGYLNPFGWENTLPSSFDTDKNQSQIQFTS